MWKGEDKTYISWEAPGLGKLMQVKHSISEFISISKLKMVIKIKRWAQWFNCMKTKKKKRKKSGFDPSSEKYTNLLPFPTFYYLMEITVTVSC